MKIEDFLSKMIAKERDDDMAMIKEYKRRIIEDILAHKNKGPRDSQTKKESEKESDIDLGVIEL